MQAGCLWVRSALLLSITGPPLAGTLGNHWGARSCFAAGIHGEHPQMPPARLRYIPSRISMNLCRDHAKLGCTHVPQSERPVGPSMYNVAPTPSSAEPLQLCMGPPCMEVA